MTSSHGSADEPFGVNVPAPGFEERRRLGPGDRSMIVDTAVVASIGNVSSGVFRKRARLCAIRIDVPFEVETDQGVVKGEPGDWLATNHPDDDPGSDVWVVSADRMAATYEPAVGEFEEV